MSRSERACVVICRRRDCESIIALLQIQSAYLHVGADNCWPRFIDWEPAVEWFRDDGCCSQWDISPHLYIIPDIVH